MINTKLRHNAILIKKSDLGDNMPSHFTERYGKLNPETGRNNMRSWGELIQDVEYIQTHGAAKTLKIDKTEYLMIALNLFPDMGDFEYDAAYKPGENKTAPDGQVLNMSQMQEFYDKYSITKND